MRTKSLATFALAGTLAFTPLVGCMDQTATDSGMTNETTEQVDTTEQTESMSGEDTTVVEGDGQLQGGWTVNTEVTTSLSDDQQAIFDQAAADYDGVELEGVAVLASRPGTGTDHAYLCKAVTTSENQAISWAIAVVNDNNGASSISSVEGIELDDIEVGSEEQQASDLMGDWELSSLDAAAELPGGAAQAFQNATDGYVGMSLTPMALLGTLDASGTNYLVLCQGTTTTAEDPQQALCVAHVYEDSTGNAEFADVAQLDLLAYA